jgi:hypothetical protein
VDGTGEWMGKVGLLLILVVGETGTWRAEESCISS